MKLRKGECPAPGLLSGLDTDLGVSVNVHLMIPYAKSHFTIKIVYCIYKKDVSFSLFIKSVLKFWTSYPNFRTSSMSWTYATGIFVSSFFTKDNVFEFFSVYL